MFSLLITIISIALVAALAVTTIYYGGSVFREGKAKANAAAINSQAQQILGAAQVFRANRGRWPEDIDELVTASYLSMVPIVPVAYLDDMSLMNVAYASVNGTWDAVQPNVPYYWVHSQVNRAECQQLNLLVRGDNGIFNAAKPSLHTQCFGPAADYTVVIGFPELASTTALADAISAADPNLWVDETGTGYSVPATVTAPIGGGPGGAAPTTIAPTFGPFVVAARQVGSPSFALTPPTSNSTGAFSYGSSNTGVASIVGNIVTINAAGTTTISAVQGAAPGFNSALTTAEFVATPIPIVAPTVGAFSVAAQPIGSPAFTLTAPSSNSPGAFSYSSSAPAVATVSGNTVTIVGVGTTDIIATQASAPGYSAATRTAAFTVTPLPGPTFGAFAVPAKTLGAAAFVITPPTSNSAGAFSYASSDTNVATVSGSTITLVAAGTTTIAATQAAAPGYASGTTSTAFTVSPVPVPTLGSFTVPARTLGTGSFSLTPPTSNSPGAFSYSSSTPAVATVSGNTVTMVAAGETTITATQAAASGYTSATTSTSFTVVPPVAPAMGSFSIPSKSTGEAQFSITPPTSNSSGAFTYVSSNTAVATISGSTVTIVGAGTTTITATQAAAPGYTSSTAVADLVVSQTVVAPTMGAFTVANRQDGSAPFTLTQPTSNSPGAFTYSSSNTSVASVSGNVVTIIGEGSSVITATQAAATGYTSGTRTATFNVTAKSVPGFTAFTIPNQKLYSQTYTIVPPGSTSPGSWTFTSSDPSKVSISGNVATLIANGTPVITATQAASGTFASGSTTATMSLMGPVREWLLAYPSNNWYGACPSGWRQATKDELLGFRANPGTTSFYGGWNWASDAVGSYKVIVNMSDGRVTNDLPSNTYARMCTK